MAMAQSDSSKYQETHFVFLGRRRVSSLSDSRIHKSARVLNLNDNRLQDLNGIALFKHLTVLYLVNNGISDMSPVTNLVTLKKLFLGYNYIKRLEGLENCFELRELYIGSQRMNSSFSFSTDTITFLTSLKILDASRNHVSDIRPLSGLKGLEQLDTSFNDLKDFNHVFPALKGMKRLTVLDCSGNSVVLYPHFSEELHSCLPQLRILNGREINPAVINYYSYINNLKSFKDRKLKKNMSSSHRPRFECRINSQSVEEDSAEMTDLRDNSQYHNWRKLAIKVRPKQVAVDECLRMIAESLPTGFRSVVSRSEFYTDHLTKK